MDTFLQEIADYDRKGDYSGLARHVMSSGKSPAELIIAVHALLIQRHHGGAYVIAKMLMSKTQHVILAFAIGVGGCVFSNEQDVTESSHFLRDFVNSSTDQQKKIIYPIFEPVLDYLAQMAIHFGNDKFTFLLLEIMKAVHPYMDRQFSWSDDVPDLDIDALREKGQRESRLIQNPLPPSGSPRVRRRVVIAVRALSNPNDPASRPQDIGPRIVNAMAVYGWDAHFYGIRCEDLAQDFQDITDLCRQIQAELLILDDHIIVSPQVPPVRAQMILTLKQELPGFRVVAAHFDTWAIPTDVLLEASTLVDGIWESTSPSLPVWSKPVFQRIPILRTQLPHGGVYGQMYRPLKDRITFLGAVQGFNWHRVFWLTAAKKYNLPIDVRLVTHKDDGLTAMESYSRFMENISEATCALNLSTRPNHIQIVTGRCFEAMISGSLLIQEETQDLNYYFIAGEHYLPFSNVSELRSICKFIQNNPDEAEEIRRRGTEFARDCYSDEKIIGYLDKMLYY